jgi:uncharacterized membrane protein
MPERKEVEQQDLHPLFKARLTYGQRMADKLTAFCGSWAFVIILLVVIFGWIVINVLELVFNWDPYPFILLNLVVGSISAILLPIILMSQNRQEERDWINARYDYAINRKAEREIRLLHEKIDALKDSIEKLEKRR